MSGAFSTWIHRVTVPVSITSKSEYSSYDYVERFTSGPLALVVTRGRKNHFVFFRPIETTMGSLVQANEELFT